MTDDRGNRTNHPLYKRWSQMIKRCHLETSAQYKDYGGRGIYVCDRWREDFWHFLDDMGVPPQEGLWIERADNDGPYSPENCCWASPQQQMRNTRRARIIEFRGRKKLLTEWGKELGIPHSTLHLRLKTMSVEEAFTSPNMRGKSWKM